MQENAAQDQARKEVEESLQRSQRIIDMDWGQLSRVALVGAVIGALTWGLAILLQNIVIEPLLCRSAGNAAICGNTEGIAFNASAILVGIVGVAALVKLAAYRPLIIVIASVATLWGAQAWLGELSWFASVGWLALFYAVVYTLYSWVVRIYNLPLAVGVVIAIIIATRLVITS